MQPEVLIFTMQGCGACEILRPVAEQIAAHYQRCISTRFVDVDQESQLADAMGIEETPTVIGVNAAKQPIVRMVGHDGKSERVVRIYTSLMEGVTSCAVQPFQDV